MEATYFSVIQEHDNSRTEMGYVYRRDRVSQSEKSGNEHKVLLDAFLKQVAKDCP